MSKAGDKCSNCGVGLFERTKEGLRCGKCGFQVSIEEVEAQVVAERRIGFRAATIKIHIDDPEEGENFLRGLIVARSNNSSPYFEELIDGVNAILQPAREARLAAEVEAREAVA